MEFRRAVFFIKRVKEQKSPAMGDFTPSKRSPRAATA